MKQKERIAQAAIWALAAAGVAGCGLGGPKPLEPSSFISPNPIPAPSADIRTDARRMPTYDAPGALTPDRLRVDEAESGGLLVVPGSRPPPPAEVTGISPTVNENVQTPADVAQQRAVKAGGKAATAPMPATGPSSGEYMTLGAVVVTVNGNPIYANKVLSDIAPVLRVKARELDARQFQAVAEDEIGKQLQVLERTELEFAAAQRNLDEHDRDFATKLTEQWRQDQITQAGGSLEQARSRARANGTDFDDLVREQYRVEMRRIFFQKKEFPKVQVGADDMRKYYAEHEDQIFTERAKAKFSIIKISIEASGGHDQAMAKITGIQQRLQKGEDFSQIAGTVNDDEALLSSKGDAGFGDWIEHGAFADQKIEDAVWKLKPGQVTPIIEEPNAFFIAKLVDKKEGTNKKFEEADVQALIRRALEAEQFNALREKVQHDLMDEAIIFPAPPDPGNIGPVIEMAMQMYPIWRK